ncbi:PTS transporter subunit IIC [Maledivibacter halophilus]|uniref:PTS system, galactitol-specific IIC component n=1 Tax=Maledivibacter halophilus TaxID=36842 RepID=A0A1T5MJN0_9FIRM|nr:PTS transporter subunit IIC [Maledivibacter halophilus]SKC88089.1 PTS system, galactitol-specific IIC component [Maledivibacter halophilus]
MISQTIMSIFEWVFAQGAPVIVPISVLILGLIFRAPKKAIFPGALRMGVGFTALFALVGIIFSALGPAANEMASHFGLSFSVTDLGWPTQSGIVFAIPWSMAAIAGFILLNSILVAFGVVDTLNVDFNNHWIFVFYMGATLYTTGSWVCTILVGLIFWFVSLKMADWLYPMIDAYYDMPMEGITITHAYSILWAPVGFLLDKLWDSIPIIRDIQWDPDTIKEEWGFFGEPVFMGWLIGLFVGVIAYFDWPPTGEQISSALSLAFTVSFFMLLLPRAAELIVAGMAPLSDAVRMFVTKKMPGRKFHLGLDAAVLVGAPEHVAIGVLTTPIAFLIAFLLPGNKMLPLGDVAGLFIFICVFITNTNRGNIFRGLLNSALLLIPVSFWIGSAMSPANMAMVKGTGFVLPEGASLISSLCVGTTPFGFALYKISQFFTGIGTFTDLMIGICIIIGFAFIWYLMRNRPKQYAKELLGEESEG